jgi:hypothetical protein
MSFRKAALPSNLGQAKDCNLVLCWRERDHSLLTPPPTRYGGEGGGPCHHCYSGSQLYSKRKRLVGDTGMRREERGGEKM